MPTTFQKRQKEMKRMEKARMKAERRAQKKLEPRNNEEDELKVLTGPAPLEDDPLADPSDWGLQALRTGTPLPKLHSLQVSQGFQNCFGAGQNLLHLPSHEPENRAGQRYFWKCGITSSLNSSSERTLSSWVRSP